MMLNVKLNDTAQKILWEEDIHMCKRVRNSMANTGSTTSPLKNINRKKLKIIGLFLEFGRIGYVTKQEKFKKQITGNKFKAIMVEYQDNHTKDMYKL